jgi:hypothetical membrane protein
MPNRELVRTRRLLACGIAGSVLFVGSALIQGATRPGYDPSKNYVSSLSLGPDGWIMIVTFLVTAALMAACAVGLSRGWPAGRGSVWIPRLIGLFAAGILCAGVFTADPDRNYPPGSGAPANGPSPLSWHGLLHIVSAEVMFFSVVVAAVICTIRFQEEDRPVWAFYSAVSALVILYVLSSHPPEHIRGIVQRVGLLAAFGWVAALAAQTRSRLRD